MLNDAELEKIDREIKKNIQALFALGEHHLQFALAVDRRHWRQKTSRFYYAALNIKRAVSLCYDGRFSTDSSDHKVVGSLPRDFPDANAYAIKLPNLRDDRNLSDYGHVAEEGDLVLPLAESEVVVQALTQHAKKYLQDLGAL
ncbi:MAG: hypothetical protein L6R28_17365 [Planctomycetes bacterium]|nr:hypothetical protein [Planctomycetota bacterium]